MFPRLERLPDRARKKFFVALNLEIYTLLPFAAGWSSLVARQAHNLKVAGSNPAPAPKIITLNTYQKRKLFLPSIRSRAGFEPTVL